MLGRKKPGGVSDSALGTTSGLSEKTAIKQRPKCRMTRRKSFPGRVPESAKALMWE